MGLVSDGLCSNQLIRIRKEKKAHFGNVLL